MSTKLKHQPKENGDNVVALPTKCSAEGCGKKSDRMNFCPEHYSWFKFGLLTKDGKKPIDFDKKFMAYQRKHAA